MIDAARLAKFKRRAPHISTQAHIDRILRSMPDLTPEDALTHIQPLLVKGLVAAIMEKEVEVKPLKADAPTLHEDTAIRLNALVTRNAELEAALKDRDLTIASLKTSIEERDEVIEHLAKA